MKYVLCFSLVFAYYLDLGRSAQINTTDISYVFYSREHFNGVKFNFDKHQDLSILSHVFNRHEPTICLIHGWRDSYEADSNTYIREAILSKTNANIIKIDWGVLASQSYSVAREAVPSVGRLAGQLLRDIATTFTYSLKDITLVGFSLGAHIAGNIGKELTGEISLIVALDPAGPLISSSDTKYCINPADADYVQVIHTNSGTLGMRDAVGHADFYPNGGSRQAGCGLDLVGFCSHNRAWEYFAESVTSNRFVSKRCVSWNDYNNGNCDEDSRLMGGLSKIDRNARGIFFLETDNASPYGRG